MGAPVSVQSSRSVSPVDSVVTVAASTSSNNSRYKNFNKKARRLTFAAPEDLLYCAAPAALPLPSAASSSVNDLSGNNSLAEEEAPAIVGGSSSAVSHRSSPR